MPKALIGYTGFVGSNLFAQGDFTDLYNSKNIEQIRGKEFELVVCAGARGIKWLANKEPEKDIGNIRYLMRNLEEIKTEEFILISTIDVYPTPFGVDEDTPIDTGLLLPYGRHRRILEEFAEANFKNAFIVRLPDLFGNGIKKNIIYDFLNNNCLEMIHQDGIFQFYNLQYLWRDIKKVRENKVKLVNFTTEPVSVKDIAKNCFGIDFSNNLATSAANHNMFTKYSFLWGRQGPYIYSRSEVLADIASFVKSQKG